MNKTNQIYLKLTLNLDTRVKLKLSNVLLLRLGQHSINFGKNNNKNRFFKVFRKYLKTLLKCVQLIDRRQTQSQHFHDRFL